MPDPAAATERAVLGRVRDRAKNLSSVFPYQRQGNALYLNADDWRVLAGALNRILDSSGCDLTAAP